MRSRGSLVLEFDAGGGEVEGTIEIVLDHIQPAVDATI